jgi:hypothetical protein
VYVRCACADAHPLKKLRCGVFLRLIGFPGLQYSMRQALMKAAKALLLVFLFHHTNLATLSLFNQAFEFVAVITSDSHQVSSYHSI